MNRIGLPSGVSEMEHLQHSFADHTRQGGFLKSLSDQPHKRRPADPRKRGVSFRRQRNKLLSRVKLRLRYRLSFLRSIRNAQSKSRNAAIATSACMQPGSVWILRIQSSYLRYMPFFRHPLNSINSGLEPRDGTFHTSLSTRTARRR